MSTEPAKKQPELKDIIEAWNFVAENLTPAAVFLMQSGQMTLGDCGKVEDAAKVIMGVLNDSQDLHNQQVLEANNERAELEAPLRKKLEERRPNGEILKTGQMKSVDNDEAPLKPRLSTTMGKPPVKLAAKRKAPRKANVRKKPAK